MLVVNFAAGPCAAKTSTSAAVFALAKSQHLSCEHLDGCEKRMVYAGDLTKLKSQPWLLGEQNYRIELVYDKVDFVLNDFPLFLNCVYNDKYPESFNKATIDIFKRYNNLTFFLERGDDYCSNGRIHSKEESVEIDKKILKLLVKNNIMFFKIKGGFESANGILEVIKNRLMLKPGQKSVSWFKSTMGLL